MFQLRRKKINDKINQVNLLEHFMRHRKLTVQNDLHVFLCVQPNIFR
jgi:hypothetical protein